MGSKRSHRNADKCGQCPKGKEQPIHKLSVPFGSKPAGRYYSADFAPFPCGFQFTLF
jgi:hypothetical protein